MRSAFFDIIQARGFRGLYAGLSPTLVEIVPYAGLQFGTYDTFKRWTTASLLYHFYLYVFLSLILLLISQFPSKWSLQSWNHRHYPNSGPGNTEDGLSSFQLFLCGLAAGTCAKLVCHPLDVVKKRFQVRIFALCWMRFVNLAIYDLRLKID